MSVLRRDGSGLLVRRVRGKTIPQSCWPSCREGTAHNRYRRRIWRWMARNAEWDTSSLGRWILRTKGNRRTAAADARDIGEILNYEPWKIGARDGNGAP